ncbi:hypothetical protein WOLCODRAFT_136395 [Wolfiporia cocos MD-104 SS10]|uniref:AAA+ ATPase domain-containing protein n=1 Tax=Wolfiporia cocos (strain MD-104) TaxID=742152 RepID=A0A2H3JRQ1_WOLCO|nr:hypothetical protein WOLCODRAFT_136395 [Wolfiporia cocos MD-104 SS10]
MSTSYSKPMRLIAVTGPTGAGKTTFINKVCGSKLREGVSMHSCTDRVQIARWAMANQDIIMIDTPGFDDTTRSRADILRDIARFLEQTYEKGRKLDGLIYMHRISDNRVGGIARENFGLFTKICGDEAMRIVSIVTTMWEFVPEQVGASRELELKQKTIFFKDAIDHGARMERHFNDEASAKMIVMSFLQTGPQTLQLQKEMVDDHKLLPETAAGTQLQIHLQNEAESYRKQLQDQRSQLSAALAAQNAAHQEEVQELKEANQRLHERLSKVQLDMRKLLDESTRDTAWRRTMGQMGRIGRRKVFRLSRDAHVEYRGWNCFDIFNFDN